MNIGARKIALYLWRDEFESALDLVAHEFSCYHIDDEYTFQTVEVPLGDRERRVIERVDQVIVHSSALWSKKGTINPNTALIPNGVDYEQFSARKEIPTDLRVIRGPIIGYAGVVKKQLDLNLLIAIARLRPQWSVVLVGPISPNLESDPAYLELRTFKNVYFLGHKSPESLAAYMQHFDVCMMCYELNDYTKYIYPLKLNEYLAGGRPVISSALETVVSTQAPVVVASGTDEWISSIERCLLPEATAPAEIALRRLAASRHDWDALSERVVEIFRGCTR